MNIYLVSRTDDWSYDEYDSFVCYAEDEETASKINPAIGEWDCSFSAWCKTPEFIEVKFLGIADNAVEAGIILESFNAG